MKQILRIVCVLSCIAACKSTIKSASEVKTDLGYEGNAEVVNTYLSYTRKTQHCNWQGEPHRRAIVTGFGLFSGAPYNISGVVQSSMASPTFFPAKVSTTENLALQMPAPGTLTPADFGGRVVQRTLEIDGVKVDFCFITLDVKWDLAAAIVLYEAINFRPGLILMTGRGGDNSAHFEWGALNETNGRRGYNSDGGTSTNNIPLSSYILNDNGARIQSPIAMTWDGEFLANESRLLGDALGLKSPFVAETEARGSNSYICNNTSFVILHALSGHTVSLAGDTLKISSNLRGAKAGFFHYPYRSTNDSNEVGQWALIIANAVKNSLP